MVKMGLCISLNLKVDEDLSFAGEIMIDFLAQIYPFLRSFIAVDVFS